MTAALTGVALAASAGFRVFLPLLAAGAAGRWGGFPVAPPLAWITSDAALVMFGVAALVEIVADKVPVIDHALDLLQTVLSPVAGVLVLLGPATALAPAFGLAIAIIAGRPSDRPPLGCCRSSSRAPAGWRAGLSVLDLSAVV
jgi:hypothetical protein